MYPFERQTNNPRPMNALEQRFMETFPNILRDLTEEIRKLRKELEVFNHKDDDEWKCRLRDRYSE